MASVVVSYSDGRRALASLDGWSMIAVHGAGAELVVAGGKFAANASALPVPKAMRLKGRTVEVDCTPGVLANTTIVPVNDESEIVVQPGEGEPVRLSLEGATGVELL